MVQNLPHALEFWKEQLLSVFSSFVDDIQSRFEFILETKRGGKTFSEVFRVDYPYSIQLERFLVPPAPKRSIKRSNIQSSEASTAAPVDIHDEPKTTEVVPTISSTRAIPKYTAVPTSGREEFALPMIVPNWFFDSRKLPVDDTSAAAPWNQQFSTWIQWCCNDHKNVVIIAKSFIRANDNLVIRQVGTLRAVPDDETLLRLDWMPSVFQKLKLPRLVEFVSVLKTDRGMAPFITDAAGVKDLCPSYLFKTDLWSRRNYVLVSESFFEKVSGHLQAHLNMDPFK